MLANIVVYAARHLVFPSTFPFPLKIFENEKRIGTSRCLTKEKGTEREREREKEGKEGKPYELMNNKKMIEGVVRFGISESPRVRFL